MANFNKKEVRVKSFTRKGKIVKGHNKFIETFVKTDKDGKRKLTNTSKVLVGLGTVGAIGAGAGYGYLAKIGKISQSKVKRDAAGKIIVDLENKPLKFLNEKIQVDPYRPHNVPDLTPEQTLDVDLQMERSLKKSNRLTTKATGEDFWDLIDRRDGKNKYNLEMRQNNAKGLIGGYGNYDLDRDLYQKINSNRRKTIGNKNINELKEARKQRKEIAKLLKQQLGGRYKGAAFRALRRLIYF
ncbi:hypothetical protein [Scytonema sp. NUACC26]|uniref:hypothetical protein n=1 Tax=Scytonema sp. NUACC26 TaxID=3140176 RepID=UPI0034DB9064